MCNLRKKVMSVNIERVIKYLFVVVIIILVGKIVFKELFDDRPFRFEEYKTDEQLEEAAKLKFPVGRDLDQIICDLEKSGADCDMRVPYQPKKYEIIAECRYMTSLFSLHPIENYEIWLYGDKSHKLGKLGARRLSGFMLISP